MRFPPLLPLLFTCATKLTKSQNLYFYTSNNASVCTNVSFTCVTTFSRPCSSATSVCCHTLLAYKACFVHLRNDLLTSLQECHALSEEPLVLKNLFDSGSGFWARLEDAPHQPLRPVADLQIVGK